MYFITFTRKMGAGGSEIAWRVATQLGYSFYDTEAIGNAAREMGFMKDVAEVDERAPSLFERFFFSREGEIHLDRLSSVIYELASKGSAVFLGRGSHALLRDFECALHVRVTASLERRLRNLVADGLQEEVALRAVHRSDREREAFTKFAFGVDWENPELYDIVLNMDHLSVNLAVETVVHLARTEEIRARSADAIRSLQTMALTKRAEAALIEAGLSLTYFSLAVPEPGKIHLTGYAPAQSEVTRAYDVLRGVKGVESVDSEIQITRFYPIRQLPL